MKPIQLDIDVATVDPDGISDGVASSGTVLLLTGALTSGADLDGIADGVASSGASLSLNGTLVANGKYTAADKRGHIIRILDTATVDQSGATFTITGKDENNQDLSEDITGPVSGAAVFSTNRFMTISSITVANGAACGTVDVGANGVFISADSLAHQLDIIDTATVDQSGATFTITGLDADGRVQTEAVTGPTSGATVESSKYFLEVYNVAIANGAACGTVDFGTVDEIATKTIVLDHYQGHPPTIHADVTGTLSLTVQTSLKNPMDSDAVAPYAISDQEDLSWIADGNFTTKTASLIDDLAVAGIRCMRLILNSYSTGAEVQLYITQPRSV